MVSSTPYTLPLLTSALIILSSSPAAAARDYTTVSTTLPCIEPTPSCITLPPCSGTVTVVHHTPLDSDTCVPRSPASSSSEPAEPTPTITITTTIAWLRKYATRTTLPLCADGIVTVVQQTPYYAAMCASGAGYYHTPWGTPRIQKPTPTPMAASSPQPMEKGRVRMSNRATTPALSPVSPSAIPTASDVQRHSRRW